MAMHKSQMDFFVKKISFSKLPQVIRGLVNIRPKSIDYPKIFANVARMIPHHSSDPLMVLTSLEEWSVRRIYDFLVDKNQMIVVSPVMQSLFHNLKTMNGPFGILGMSECQPESSPNLLPFVSSIHSNDYLLESQAAQKVILDLKHYSKTKELSDDPISIVIEEKPGKFSVLNLDDLTVKTNLKRFITISQPTGKDLQRPPFPAEPGFAVYYASIDKPSQDNQWHLAMASIQHLSRSPEMELLDLVSVVEDWIKHLGMDTKSIGRVHLSISWLPMAAYFGQLLAPVIGDRPSIHFLDHGLGWHPIGTLFQSWSEMKQGPILYIYHGHNQSFLSLIWI